MTKYYKQYIEVKSQFVPHILQYIAIRFWHIVTALQLAYSLKMKLWLFYQLYHKLENWTTSINIQVNIHHIDWLTITIYHFHLSKPICRFLYKQCGSRSASFFRSWLIMIYTVYHTTKYAVLHNIIDMKMTCFNLLKVVSDGNFYLLFGEKTTRI